MLCKTALFWLFASLLGACGQDDLHDDFNEVLQSEKTGNSENEDLYDDLKDIMAEKRETCLELSLQQKSILQEIENMLKACKNNTADTQKIDTGLKHIQNLISLFGSQAPDTPTTITIPPPPPKTTTPTTTTTSTTPAPPPTTTTTRTTIGTSKPIQYCNRGKDFCSPVWKCRNQKKTKDNKYLISLKKNRPCHYLETCCSHNNMNNITQIYDQKKIEPADWGYVNYKGVYMTVENSKLGEADFGEFPWTVVILSTSNVNLMIGGSLITPRVVLSSASKLITPNQLKVRAGDWDTKTDNEILPYQERLVSEKVIHPKYSIKEFANDIALLFLKESFDLMRHIIPISLPTASLKDFDYNNCIVVGWNSCLRGDRCLLTKMSLSIKDEQKHETKLSVKGSSSNLKYSTGSALACPRTSDSTNRYYQIGIWSHGFSKDHLEFTKVSSFLSWINSTLGTKKIQLS